MSNVIKHKKRSARSYRDNLRSFSGFMNEAMYKSRVKTTRKKQQEAEKAMRDAKKKGKAYANESKVVSRKLESDSNAD